MSPKTDIIDNDTFLCHKHIQHTKSGDELRDFWYSMYNSVISRQEAIKKESLCIVCDYGKRVHLVTYTGIQLLLYIAKRYPVKTGDVYDSKFGPISFEPEEVKRDDAVILCRSGNGFCDDFSVDDIYNQLAYEFNEDEFKLLADYLKARVKDTIRSHDSHKLLDQVADLGDFGGDEDNKDYMKYKILETWFNPFFDGPSSITRILDIRIRSDNPYQNEFEGPILNKIYEEYPEMQKNNRRCNWMLILDDENYIITKNEAQKMKFPEVIDIDYVAVSESSDDVREIKENEEEILVKGKNLYKIVIAHRVDDHDQDKYRLKLIPDKAVFDPMLAIYKRLINSTSFVAWTENVNLILWAGRHEQEKLKVMRDYKNQNNELQDEIERLQAMIDDIDK